MAFKHVFAVVLSCGLLASGCLRLMDEPTVEAEGAAGFECYDDKDCNSGSHCIRGVSIMGVCGEPGECESHSECGAGQRCLMDRCAPVECTGDYDESESICGVYKCDDTTFTCSKKCDEDYDCLMDTVCRAGACVSAKCTTQNEALLCKGYTCDVVLSQCREPGYRECEDNGCATGYACVDKDQCIKACNPTTGSSSQCGNYRCLTKDLDYPNTVSYCTDRCGEHTDCLNGSVCVEGQCGPKP